MSSTILGIMFVAALALGWGGIKLLQRKDVPKIQPWLMILLAVILLGNIAIWTVPDSSGVAPVERELR